jgi:hypothetical protein
MVTSEALPEVCRTVKSSASVAANLLVRSKKELFALCLYIKRTHVWFGLKIECLSTGTSVPEENILPAVNLSQWNIAWPE